MIYIIGFYSKHIEIFGFSITFVTKKEIRQYFSIKAFVQNNYTPYKSLINIENFVFSMIFILFISDFCQIFIEMMLNHTYESAISNDLVLYEYLYVFQFKYYISKLSYYIFCHIPITLIKYNDHIANLYIIIKKLSKVSLLD